MVPEVIYNEIRDSIFRSDVLRREWKLRITVLPPSDCRAISEETRERMEDEGMFLVDLDTSYVVENLNDRQVPFLVTGWLDLDVPIEEVVVPRFSSVSVGEAHWTDELSETLAKSLYGGSGPQTLSQDLSVLIDADKQIRFKKHVLLPRGGCVRVAYGARCAFRAPGSQVVSSQSPADGIQIETNGTTGLAFDVLPLHPQQGGLTSTGSPPSRQWQFARGILPWQGFQIVSSVIPSGGDPT